MQLHACSVKNMSEKLNNILVSNNRVSLRIKDMSDYIEYTVNKGIKRSLFFSVQVDESTDVSNLSILLVIARYLNDNVLFGYSFNVLSSCRNRGEAIFIVTQGYLCKKEIDWTNFCVVCMEGGKFISGCDTGLCGRIKEITPHEAWSHCCIHKV